jgi:hypothetical protein
MEPRYITNIDTPTDRNRPLKGGAQDAEVFPFGLLPDAGRISGACCTPTGITPWGLWPTWAKWARELAALGLFYKIAVRLGFMQAPPVLTRTVTTPNGGTVEVPDLARRMPAAPT